MRIDAELLALIQDVDLAGAFLFAWTDEWFTFTWNTVAHHAPADRRPLWHDPLTNEQHFGLVATDATGAANPDPVTLGSGADAVTARVDEAYLHLRVPVRGAQAVTIGFETLPSTAAAPPPGAAGPRAEAAFVLDLGTRTGGSWIRADLDPVPLDYAAPAGARPAPHDGWLRYQLNTNRDLVIPSTGERMPAEFVDVGVLRYGRWEPGTSGSSSGGGSDSRALWYIDDSGGGRDLVVRVPWALAGFADPSSRSVLVPRGRAATTTKVDRVGLTVSRDGADRFAGDLTWDEWQRVGYAERLKTGAGSVQGAMVRSAARGERAS